MQIKLHDSLLSAEFPGGTGGDCFNFLTEFQETNVTKKARRS